MFYPLSSFDLDTKFCEDIQSRPYQFGFSGFGATVFYRSFSRQKKGDFGATVREQWPDVVLRVAKGTMQCWKTHCERNRIIFPEDDARDLLSPMFTAMHEMKWTPPGRGMWAMGSPIIPKVGGMALNNCGFCSTGSKPTEPVAPACKVTESVCWAFHALFLGSGIGFNTWFRSDLQAPAPGDREIFVVPDSREGWVDSLRRLMRCYVPENGKTLCEVEFDVSKVRPRGEIIKTFGGIASGPEPLIKMHHRVRAYSSCRLAVQNGVSTAPEAISVMMKELRDAKADYEKLSDNDFKNLQASVLSNSEKTYGTTRWVVDLFNSLGACVVSGGIRRSSQIALGYPGDLEFLELKNSSINPERTTMWMSNNTVQIWETEQFTSALPGLIQRARVNGEPGIQNMLAVKHGRLGRTPIGREAEPDPAIGTNPCGEISLEDKEICCLATVYPKHCVDASGKFSESVLLDAVHYATIYAMIVSTVPTHSLETNAIVMKNHRIGVSMTGLAPMYDEFGSFEWTRILRRCHHMVRQIAQEMSTKLVIREPIRVCTEKPEGSTSLMAGTAPGTHFPPESRYVLRSIRIAIGDPVANFLIANGLIAIPDPDADNTVIFQFPIDQGDTRSAEDISLMEQLMMAMSLQSEWSDNSVSISVYFDPEDEGPILEKALAIFLPHLKTISVFPRMRRYRTLELQDGMVVMVPNSSSPRALENLRTTVDKLTTPEKLRTFDAAVPFAYQYPPYVPLSEEEFRERFAAFPKLDYSKFSGGREEMPRGCSNDTCLL